MIEGLLSDDFRCTSPHDDHISKSTYFERCWPFSNENPTYKFEQLFENGNEAFVLYECETKSGVKFGNTEFFRIEGSKIKEVEVYYGFLPEDVKNFGRIKNKHKRHVSKAPILIESLKDNNGKRTVSQAVFPPGAECPIHYHTEFEETFEVLEGEFTVYIGKTKLTLTAGQSTPKIKTNEIHYFKNSSQTNVLANIIFEPGHSGGENATKILNGLETDRKYELLTKVKGYNTLWIILFDMTNTLLTGIPKIIFNILGLLHGKSKIQKIRQNLLDRYCKQ